MNRLQTFQEFLARQNANIPVGGFVFNLLLAALLAFIISRLYIKFGHSLSNRRLFAKNFVLITMATMLIIALVKSSLALSLGLVGALSIVRFRAAIKEPEELTYLFLCIAIGLGLGADQRSITLVAFLVISAVLWFSSFYHRTDASHNLYLTVASDGPQKVSLDSIAAKLKEFCSSVKLRRFDQTKNEIEASFLVEYDNFEQLKKCKTELNKLDDSLRITFLDTVGV